MAHILLGWELGFGLGHIATLLPVAKALVARGHRVTLALQNTVETWPLLRDSGFTVLQAPVFFHCSGVVTDYTGSYADILAEYGYDDVDTLEPIVRAWRALLDSVNPDLVIAEHAPTLSLASYGRVPVFNLGTGFEVAYWDRDHFPVINPQANPSGLLPRLNRNIATVLQRLGQAAPEPALRAVFGEKAFVVVFAELDPYRATREVPAIGPLWSLPAAMPPLPEVPKCLVYLPADHPEIDALIEGLQTLTMPGVVYVRNANPALLEQLRSTSLQVSEAPLDLDVILPQVSVVLHHGGAGMSQRCLAYGRPQVVAPVYLEQRLTCTSLQEMGLAIKLGGIFSADQSGAALEQAVRVPRLAQLAQHHANNLQQRYPLGSLDAVVQACMEMLPIDTSKGEHATVTFVTTCKGRLHHLQQTLPLMVAEKPDEIVVVDYDCPQRVGDWVEATYPLDLFPQIKVIRVTDDEGFSIARARNSGAKAATSRWICFIDADICVKPGWMQWLRNSLNADDVFYMSPVRHRWTPEFADTYGTVIVNRDVFNAIDGYDEVFRGWGGEDGDFYFRLREKRIAVQDYPLEFLSCIHHSHAERLQFYVEKDIGASQLAAQYYRAVKSSLMRLEGTGLPHDAREELMQVAQSQVRQARNAPDQHPKIITEFLLDGEMFRKSSGYQIRQQVVTSIEPFIVNKNIGSPTKKFCVMTVGRSGSTSFMNCLEQYDDIAVPGKNVACEDNELLHVERIDQYMQEYGMLSGTEIITLPELIESFYTVNERYGYAGFKSMPDRDPDFRHFIKRDDMQFITLIRNDIASTVASFMLARITGGWKRQGEKQSTVWHFDQTQHGKQVVRNLSYILQAHAALATIPNAIALTYEDLCNPLFENQALNTFFEREIRLDNPKPPTSGSAYIDNWEEFEQFITQARRSILVR